MKIKVISDTHNMHDRMDLGSGDLLIHCGDSCTKGNYTEGKKFIYWFNKQNYKYKIFVGGNHDSKIKKHPELLDLIKDLGLFYLRDDLIEIEGLTIYGNDTTFKSYDKWELVKHRFPGTLRERTEAWKNIPEGVDILITHQPPWGILDQSNRGAKIGCKELLKKVREVKPKCHIFGHCHEDKGKMVEVFDTKFYNMACLDRDYILRHPQGFDLDILDFIGRDYGF